MTALINLLVVIVSSGGIGYIIGYRRGHKAGCAFTIDYFGKHPIPREWLTKMPDEK